MKILRKIIQSVAIAFSASLLILLASCNPNPPATSTTPEAAKTAAGKTAKATLTSTAEGATDMGEVSFSPTEAGLLVEANLKNAPAGKHGLHIHKVGSCEDGGKAAEGHFNPDDTPHGYLPEDGLEKAHAGDLGNIDIAEDGMGSLSLTVPALTLDNAQYGIAGRGVILHEKADDFGQPTGNAGGRIGCGVIE